MYKSALTSIICCRCKNDLQLQEGHQTAENDNKIVTNATLYCSSCSACYPVVNTVPILIDNNSLHEFLSDYHKSIICADKYGCFSNELKRIVEGGRKNINNKVAQVANNWSVQWNLHNTKDTIWEKPEIISEHIPLDQSFLNRKGVILELGCGNGRCINHFAKFSSSIYGIDLSDSIFNTALRMRDFTNIHLFKADIMNLPFKDDLFDVIYSDHVLHHLPDINLAFREVQRAAKQDHQFCFNLYSKENNNIMTNFIEQLKRKAFNKMPLMALHKISNFPAIILFILIRMLYIPVSKKSKSIYRLLPLHEHMTFWFHFQYDTLLQACFDLLHAPIANYFSRDDICRLADNVNFNIQSLRLLRQTLWICKGRFRLGLSLQND